MTDKEYLELTDAIAKKSKDRSTKIGALLLHIPTEHMIVGWNDIPVAVKDTDERRERPAKYFYTEHAERNVIFSAVRQNVPIPECVLYTKGVPCADCARATLLTGIKKIVVWKRGSGLETEARNSWGDSIEAGRNILTEGGVEIVEVEKDE